MTLRGRSLSRPLVAGAERLASLPRWLDTYNRRRPHAGLEGQTPLSVLVNKVNGNDT